MKKGDNINLFFVVEFVLCFLMVYGVLWNKPSITSNAFAISFITLIGEFVFQSFKIKESKLLMQVSVIMAVSLICVAISFIYNDKSVDFDSLKEYFIFLAAIIFMYLCCYIEINSRTMHFILKFNLVIGFMYYLAYKFAPKINNFTVGLDFNFGNPNFAGMWIFQSLLYCTLAFLIYKQPIMRVISGTVVLLLLVMLNKTSARNCQIAYVLFIGICIWRTTKKSGKISKKIIFLINVLPILFVFLYLNYIRVIIEKGWFSFLVSKGKSLDSRVKIWTRFFEKLGNRWVTGEYITCLGNSHNAHMVILCSYGLVTLILTIFFTYNVSTYVNEKASDKRNGYCLAAFFATMFMGFGEGALFAGGIGLYVMACSYLCMSRFDFERFDIPDYEKGNIGLKRIYDDRLIKDKKRNLI